LEGLANGLHQQVKLSGQFIVKLIPTLPVGIGGGLFTMKQAQITQLLQRHLKATGNLCKLLIESANKGQQLRNVGCVKTCGVCKSEGAPCTLAVEVVPRPFLVPVRPMYSRSASSKVTRGSSFKIC